jgi:uncharacterized protein
MDLPKVGPGRLSVRILIAGVLLLHLILATVSQASQQGYYPTDESHPVFASIEAGDRDAVRRLIDTGDANFLTTDGLLERLLEAEMTDLAKLCLERIRGVERGLANAMMSGEAQAGNLRAIDFLLANGVAADAPDVIGETPIMQAIRMQQTAAVRHLIEAGADVNHEGVVGTVLTMAVFDGGPSVLEAVLAGRPDVNRSTKDGETALGNAARSGFDQAIEMLLEVPDIDVDLRDGRGLTPLMTAASGGCDRCVVLLLEAGASTKLEDAEGNTAAAIAEANGFLATASIIRGEDPGLAERFREPQTLVIATDEEIATATEILESLVVRRDVDVIRRSLHPDFRSMTLEQRLEFEEAPAGKDIGWMLSNLWSEGEGDCLGACKSLSDCIKPMQRPGRAPFDVGAVPVDSDTTIAIPAAAPYVGQQLLGFGGSLRCGLYLTFITTRGATPEILAIEFSVQ